MNEHKAMPDDGQLVMVEYHDPWRGVEILKARRTGGAWIESRSGRPLRESATLRVLRWWAEPARFGG
jgi:hypothetical protein